MTKSRESMIAKTEIKTKLKQQSNTELLGDFFISSILREKKSLYIIKYSKLDDMNKKLFSDILFSFHSINAFLILLHTSNIFSKLNFFPYNLSVSFYMKELSEKYTKGIFKRIIVNTMKRIINI